MNGPNTSKFAITETKTTDKRMVWERPAVERLGAAQAETSNFNVSANDGNIYTS